jgi:hypothetical protein
VLIGAFAGTGVAFGLAGGLITRVRCVDGHIRVRATSGAVALWVISMGFRLGFAVWSAALVLMALGEVVVRLVLVVVRGHALQAHVSHQGRGALPVVP